MESIGNLAKKVFNEIKEKKELNKMASKKEIVGTVKCCLRCDQVFESYNKTDIFCDDCVKEWTRYYKDNKAKQELNKMTPEEFKLKMQEYNDSDEYNDESSHIAADKLMCDVLTELGFSEGIKVFNKMSKWYS